VVNAVIAPDLVIDLNLNSSQLGLLTSVYFISFASSQLALGLLLDRFGPRIINSILLIFAGMGALIFAQSHSLTGVIIGRAFIGFGVSACLMAALKAYVLWFPKKNVAPNQRISDGSWWFGGIGGHLSCGMASPGDGLAGGVHGIGWPLFFCFSGVVEGGSRKGPIHSSRIFGRAIERGKANFYQPGLLANCPGDHHVPGRTIIHPGTLGGAMA